MDFHTEAEELLLIRSSLHKIPANVQISKLARGELFVLNYLLLHEDPVFPKDLSREMMVSTARVAVLLNQMEKNGLITRSPDPMDNRQVIVALTDSGKAQIEASREEVIETIVQIFKYIGPEDTRELLRIQRKILDGFSK